MDISFDPTVNPTDKYKKDLQCNVFGSSLFLISIEYNDITSNGFSSTFGSAERFKCNPTEPYR